MVHLILKALHFMACLFNFSINFNIGNEFANQSQNMFVCMEVNFNGIKKDDDHHHNLLARLVSKPISWVRPLCFTQIKLDVNVIIHAKGF